MDDESNSLNLVRRVNANAQCPPIIGIDLNTPGAASTPVAMAPM